MKTVVLGDKNVGKRSLINRVFYPRYSKKTKIIDAHWTATGFCPIMYEKKIGSHIIKFQIWIINPLMSKKKTMGNFLKKSKPKTLGEVYCYGALAAIVVFDITNKQSFNNVQRWIKLVWNNNGRGLIPLTIIANKIDLRDNVIDSISSEKGQKLAEKFTKQSLPMGFSINYKETSINDKTIDFGEIFHELGQSYIKFINLKLI